VTVTSKRTGKQDLIACPDCRRCEIAAIYLVPIGEIAPRAAVICELCGWSSGLIASRRERHRSDGGAS
jgi:hypothetical protein